MSKVITAEEAARLVHNNATLLLNGFGSIGFPEQLAQAVGERYLKCGEPNRMELIFSAGQGAWTPNRMGEHLCHKGMLRSVIGGHITPNLRICEQLQNNEIEGYNYSMGVISHVIRESAGRHPGLLTKIGLHTFIDPRYGGGALNRVSENSAVKLLEVGGEEYLFYPAIHPDITLLRGTTADPDGNITMEKEAVYADAYNCALATRANGGKVIVQVERLSAVPANPRKVIIPGILVDAVVVAPEQWQSILEQYNPSYTGELCVPDSEVLPMVERINELNVQAGRRRERNPLHNIIAGRAAMELRRGAVVNLGIGIPEMIVQAAKKLDLPNDVILTVEAGCVGGTPAPGLNFGIAINPQYVQDMAAQFDLYDGGAVDMTFIGAMQVGKDGSVNVSRAGDRMIGVGGFTDLTQSVHKLTYCFPFSSGGLKVRLDSGTLQILEEGRHLKFCNQLDQISFNGAYSAKLGQEVLYITERCVFALTPNGICLTEIAPGISLEEDILAKMPFRPLISTDIHLMDARLFQ